eukprot:4726880-Ditylum_brightwellii.AAC.1
MTMRLWRKSYITSSQISACDATLALAHTPNAEAALEEQLCCNCTATCAFGTRVVSGSAGALEWWKRACGNFDCEPLWLTW